VPRSAPELNKAKHIHSYLRYFFLAILERYVSSSSIRKHSNMAKKDYRIVSQEKLSTNAAKIPKEWQQPSTYLENVDA
jgi:hypothetical protein